jgi:hypothetical protein
MFLWKGMQMKGTSSKMGKCILEEIVPTIEECIEEKIVSVVDGCLWEEMVTLVKKWI